ncbi:hypothetical protein, partial [Listeria booriae]|uniref:hypothetical protein n=1 Tax=Listeria booriae TaxID=1552123 RepID=UPI001C89D733
KSGGKLFYISTIVIEAKKSTSIKVSPQSQNLYIPIKIFYHNFVSKTNVYDTVYFFPLFLAKV